MKTKIAVTFATALLTHLAPWASELSVSELAGASVYVSAKAGEHTLEAAQDLAHYVKRMCDVEVQVASLEDGDAVPPDARGFVLGEAAAAEGLTLPQTESDTDGFAIELKGNYLLLAGEGDIGTYYAVAHFLELQGVRWYTPGPYGECVPKRQTLAIPDEPIRETPDLLTRRTWYHGGTPRGATKKDWDVFNRWARRNKAGGIEVGLGHMWRTVFKELGGPEAAAEQHADWFHKTDGVVDPTELCVSHPEIIELFVTHYKKQLEDEPEDVRKRLSICPDDGYFLFDCPRCRKFIYRQDPFFPNLPDASDLIVRFCNQVVEKLNQKYPNVKLCLYVYSNYQFGPQKERVHPNVIGFWAPLSFGRYHKLGDPRSPTRTMLAKALERWSEGAEAFGWRDYSFLCPDVMMPFSRLHMVSHEFPWMYERGLRYWSIETSKNWPNLMPSYYLATKLSWDMALDQQALLDEYYERYFGPAGPTMRTYQEEVIAAYEAVPFSAGNKEFAHLVFTPERLARLRRLLGHAKEAVLDDPVRWHRVQLYEFPQRQAELFMNMRASMNGFDFEAAFDLSKRLYDTVTEAMVFDPLSNNVFARDSWYAAFYLHPLEQVNEWMQGATIVHKLPDAWPVYLDAQNTAEGEGILSPETPLFDFMRLKTYTACLAEQGHERFRGAIWYHETFPMPRVPSGQALYLLLSGVDDAATVWVNSTCLGEQETGRFRPLLFEIPGLDVDEGTECTLTIRVTNLGITELGVGGIIRPASLIVREPLPGKELR